MIKKKLCKFVQFGFYLGQTGRNFDPRYNKNFKSFKLNYSIYYIKQIN